MVSVGFKWGKDLTEAEVTSPWRTLFRSQPCVPFTAFGPDSYRPTLTGGRLAVDGEDIWLTVGTLEQNDLARDPASDYGKIHHLDTSGARLGIVSVGHRNPQGLYRDTDGTLYETEHGPRGGDEFNRIVEGGDFGWPEVTFGTRYKMQAWDPDGDPRDEGKHRGYAMPLQAFVPAIGASQLIRLRSATEFPAWQGDFFVASLRARTLHRIHVAEGRVIVVEKIPLGERLRDLIELPDGRMALLTDNQDLLVLSRGDAEQEVAAAAAGSPPSEMIEAAIAAGDVAAGRIAFGSHCASCHAVEPGVALNGPSVACTFGGPIAADAAFPYTAQLGSFHDDVWSSANLLALMAEPGRFSGSDAMAAALIPSPDGRLNLVAYLAEVRRARCSPD